MSQNRWNVQPLINPDEDRELIDFPPFLRQLLVNRGLRNAIDAHAFIDGISCTDTSPYLMKDMKKVVDRIRRAVEENQKIAIYGD